MVCMLVFTLFQLRSRCTPIERYFWSLKQRMLIEGGPLLSSKLPHLHYVMGSACLYDGSRQLDTVDRKHHSFVLKPGLIRQHRSSLKPDTSKAVQGEVGSPFRRNIATSPLSLEEANYASNTLIRSSFLSGAFQLRLLRALRRGRR